MNRIATVKYTFDPLTNKAYLYIKSTQLEELYQKLGFSTREYTRDQHDLYQSYSAYLVRGINIENFHEFQRNGETFRIYTQRCGFNTLRATDDGREIVNISHARAVGISKGFSYQIRPISQSRATPVMTAYCEGLYEYYSCLKNHAADLKKWNDILTKK